MPDDAFFEKAPVGRFLAALAHDRTCHANLPRNMTHAIYVTMAKIIPRTYCSPLSVMNCICTSSGRHTPISTSIAFKIPAGTGQATCFKCLAADM